MILYNIIIVIQRKKNWPNETVNLIVIIVLTLKRIFLRISTIGIPRKIDLGGFILSHICHIMVKIIYNERQRTTLVISILIQTDIIIVSNV